MEQLKGNIEEIEKVEYLMRITIVNILLFFLFLIIPFQARAENESTEIFKTINERLSYMEDVALFKAQNHLPVEDMEREKVVVSKAKIYAQNSGLDPVYIESFIRALMSVAKAVQYRHRADFLSSTSFNKPRDLQKVVRPELLRLSNKLVEQLTIYISSYGSFNSSQYSYFDSMINVKYVTAPDKQLIFRALQNIKLLPKN